MKIYLAVIAVLGWFAVIAQFYINMTSGIATTPELVVRFFSYFTITTNLWIAITCTAALSGNVGSEKGFFSQPSVLTAATVYILVVGIIFNTVLRSHWNTVGLQWVVNELLHTAIPLLFTGFWLFHVRKQQLKTGDIGPWLIYPMVYLIFVLARGSVSGFYPYPFVDVVRLGMKKVLINCLGVTAAFVMISLLLVMAGRMKGKKRIA